MQNLQNSNPENTNQSLSVEAARIKTNKVARLGITIFAIAGLVNSLVLNSCEDKQNPSESSQSPIEGR